MGEHETVAKAASAAACRGFMACILSTIYLDRQTFRSRPLDQPTAMNSANVQVAHRPPDSVNRPNVCRRTPSVTAVSAGCDEMNFPDLDRDGPRLDRSVFEDGAHQPEVCPGALVRAMLRACPLDWSLHR
jgi:hypothetical protein